MDIKRAVDVVPKLTEAYKKIDEFENKVTHNYTMSEQEYRTLEQGIESFIRLLDSYLPY